MKRYAINKLIEWKSSKKRKPLIIRGARQVGKTWLMKEFGAEYFENTAYINFDNNDRMKNLERLPQGKLADEHSALRDWARLFPRK